MIVKRGQIYVSAILFIAIMIVIIAIVINFSGGIVEDNKLKVEYVNSKNAMLNLDNVVQDVAQQGVGSQKEFLFEMEQAKLYVEDGSLVWELESDEPIIASGVQLNLGNVRVASSADVTASQDNNFIVLENDYILVNFTRIGSSGSPVAIDTANIINYVEFDGQKTPGSFKFIAADDVSTQTGTGYTELLDEGSNLGYSRVRAVVNSANLDYEIIFMLEGQSDYLNVEVE
ncbi:hypothetical protein ACFL1H_07550 [Nanoarchaeota archaeon]